MPEISLLNHQQLTDINWHLGILWCLNNIVFFTFTFCNFTFIIMFYILTFGISQ